SPAVAPPSLLAHTATRILADLTRQRGLLPRQVLPLDASEGGRNHLFRVRTGSARLVLKVRADRSLDSTRERWALPRLPRGLGPRLVAYATPHELRHHCARRGWWRELHALDAPVGPLLWLEELPGEPAQHGLPDEVVRETGAVIAKLHGVVPREGPRLACGSEGTSILRLAEEGLAQLTTMKALDPTTLRALSRACAHVDQHLERAWRRFSFTRVRTLCHGDLRWHNLHVHDDVIRLVDLEHAGMGDPAVDLALMACRTPLDVHEELCLLDGYLSARTDAQLLDRYITVKPAVALLGAVDAVMDLVRIARADQRVVRDAGAHVQRRLPHITDELQHALTRCLGAPPSRPRITTGKPVKARGSWRGVVAVDGTAASGKSVVAQAVATRLGIPYFNTGTAYRYVALHALEMGWSARDGEDVARMVAHLRGCRVKLTPTGATEVNGREYRAALDVIPVEETVSAWAAVPAIRDALALKFRPALRAPAAVVEGRDVGSVLCPGTPHKLYVDASLDVRADRMVDRCEGVVTRKEARKLLARRDRADTTRDVAPLRPAPDAKLLDTTRLTLDDAITKAMRLLGVRG
ncbi:MAG: (d)CMP kinase, partial [Myxococcota bacterium]